MRLLLLVLLSAVLGCQSVGRSAWRDTGFEVPSTVPALLQPGTEVQLRFPYAPELDSDQVVPPDGILSFQLVGEVECAGLTASELRALLRERYAEYLKRPELNVTVASWGQRRVYVGGQVLQPGPVEFPDKLSLLESLMLVGGPVMNQANIRNILVIRQEGETRQGYAVDMQAALDGKPSEAFYLRPLDVVYVPRTEVVVAGQWIEQHVLNLIPGLVYSRNAGPARISLDSTRLRF